MANEYIVTDPNNNDRLIIGDGNRDVVIQADKHITFVKINQQDDGSGFLNLALGESSGANIVMYNNDEARLSDDTEYPQGKLGYIKDTGSLIITVKELQNTESPYDEVNNPYVIRWKSVVSAQVDNQTGQIIDLKYAEKDKDETITGTWTFNENTIFKDGISSDDAHSGLNGQGWIIYKDANTGKYILDIDNIFVRDSLEATEFEVHKVTATNGSLYVSDASKIISVELNEETIQIANLDYSSYIGNQYKLVLEENNVFREGDILECNQINGNNESKRTIYYECIVLAYTNDYIIVKMKTDSVPDEGQTLVRTNNLIEGSSRKGAVYLTSSESGSPYISVQNDGNEKVRIGNLSGISGAEGYGLYSDNAYLTGTFKLSNGTTLINYDDSTILQSIGQINSDLIGLGSKITQTENAIESLVVGDNLIYSSDPENEDLDDTIKNRWHNNNLTFTDNYITHSNNGVSIYQQSKGTVSLQDNEELEFTIATKFDSDESGTNIAIAKLSIDSNGNYEIGNSVNIKKITGIQHLKFTVGENKAVSNQYIYLHIIPNNTIVDFSLKFRNESLTRSIYSIIEQSSNSINQQITQNISGKLYQTGININGNNRSITVKTDNFKITDSTGENVTFEIGNSGNLIAKNGAKIEGTLQIPSQLIDIEETVDSISGNTTWEPRFIDLNYTYNNPLKNLQVKPRLQDTNDTSGYDGEMLTVILPGFDFIADYNENDSSTTIVNKYGVQNQDSNNIATLTDNTGIELEIYHQYVPVYDHLGLYYGGNSTVDSSDCALDVAVLVLADSKFTGNSIDQTSLYGMATFNNRGHQEPLSSGWIVSKNKHVKGILLNPGYKAKLKSVYCNGFNSNIGPSHTTVWMLENSDEFTEINVDIITMKGNNTVVDGTFGIFISNELYNEQYTSVIQNPGYKLQLELQYDSNGNFEEYIWSIQSTN